MQEQDSNRCGFCGKAQHEVNRLLQGKTAFICDACVKECQEFLVKPPPPLPGAKSHRVPPALYLEEYWRQQGCPPVPTDISANGLTPDQIEELKRVVEIVGMFKLRHDGGWDEYSINRRAQNKWPHAKIIIEDIEAIRRNWFQFGLPGLVAMIQAGKSDYLGLKRIQYHHMHHEVKSMTAVEIVGAVKQPVFIDTGCITTLDFHPELSAKTYAVGLESQYGRYRFNMVYYKPPDTPEASHFACIHTKVG